MPRKLVGEWRNRNFCNDYKEVVLDFSEKVTDFTVSTTANALFI
jgi:hypothetical protein